MPYQLDIQALEGYLRVVATGQRQAGQESTDSFEMWLRIAEASRATGLRRILAISWITGRLPTMSAYQVASQPDKFGWSRDLKLALVDHHPPSREKNAFSANVASNRGFTVRYFDDEAAAVAWLLEK